MQVNVIDNKSDNKSVTSLLPDLIGQFRLLPESPIDMSQGYTSWPKVDGWGLWLDENETLAATEVQMQDETVIDTVPSISDSPRPAIDVIEGLSSGDPENFLIAFSQVSGE